MTQGRRGVAEAATMAMPCSSIWVMRLPESHQCRQVSPSVLNRAVGSRLLSRAACLDDSGSFRHCQARSMVVSKRRRRAVTKLVPPPNYERFGVLRRCFGRESQAKLRDTRSGIVRPSGRGNSEFSRPTIPRVPEITLPSRRPVPPLSGELPTVSALQPDGWRSASAGTLPLHQFETFPHQRLQFVDVFSGAFSAAFLPGG
jgi:hypothetical protein